MLRLANSNKNSSDTIMLFVRFKDESYVSLGTCCLSCIIRYPLYIMYDASYTHDLFLTGRVEHESSNLNARPVQFVWRLKDYDRLKSLPYFKRVLVTLS